MPVSGAPPEFNANGRGPEKVGCAQGPKATIIAVSVAVLLPVFGSLVVDDTVAVLVIGWATVGVTTIVIVAAAPLAMVPSAHWTTPLSSPPQLPCEGVTDPNVTLVGNTSLTTTESAASGPALATVSV